MKILIIKLGALGDVIRTTPLLRKLKSIYPDSEITWVTKPSSKEILEGISSIDEIITLPAPEEVFTKEFDLLLSMDVDLEATQMSNRINAKEKKGFFDAEGFPTIFNEGAEYYLNTIFDDELKRTNTKTAQEMFFEIAELKFEGEKPLIHISEDIKSEMKSFTDNLKSRNKKLIGINVGSSSRWPSKSWHKDNIIEFIKKIKEDNFEILLLGGNEEISKIRGIQEELNQEGIETFHKETSNSLKYFFALISQCDLIICGDTLALHASLALHKPTIALFFCTSPNEIEGYNQLAKIISPKLKDFFPHKMDKYDEELVKSITPDGVLSVVRNITINKNSF